MSLNSVEFKFILPTVFVRSISCLEAKIFEMVFRAMLEGFLKGIWRCVWKVFRGKSEGK